MNLSTKQKYFAVHQKLTQHCKSTILQENKPGNRYEHELNQANQVTLVHNKQDDKYALH